MFCRLSVCRLLNYRKQAGKLRATCKSPHVAANRQINFGETESEEPTFDWRATSSKQAPVSNRCNCGPGVNGLETTGSSLAPRGITHFQL